MGDRTRQGFGQQVANGGGGSPFTPQNNANYYVATTGNDNNPGTPASPLATVQEALKRLGESQWTGYAIVHMANGTYMMPPDITVPSPLATGLQVLVTGTPVPSPAGTKVTTAVGATAGNCQWITVSCASLAVPDNSLIGHWIVFDGNITPLLANGAFEIHGNKTIAGVTTLELTVQFSNLATPVPGDTFTVNTVGVHFQFGQRTNVMNGGGVVFQWVSFEDAGQSFLWLVENEFTANACVFKDTTGGGPTSFSFNAGFIGDSSILPTVYQNRVGNELTGCYIFGCEVSPNSSGFISMEGTQFDGSGIRASFSGAIFPSSELIWTQSALPFSFANVTVSDNASGYIFNSEWRGLTQNQLISVFAQGEISIDTCTMDGNTCTQLMLVGGGNLNTFGIDGVNVAGGTPLVLKNQSACARGGTPVTVTGTTPGQDVKVGAVAVPVAWAAGNTNDLALGAASELCLLSP